jgi:hypothetical protein
MDTHQHPYKMSERILSASGLIHLLQHHSLHKLALVELTLEGSLPCRGDIDRRMIAEE